MREHATPLLTALRKLTVEEQHQFANLAGTSRNYLYQLACCNRNSPGVTLAKAISEASVVMHVQTLGRSP
jgi:transcriptional regulator with XRE-family HTH domain